MLLELDGENLCHFGGSLDSGRAPLKGRVLEGGKDGVRGVLSGGNKRKCRV